MLAWLAVAVAVSSGANVSTPPPLVEVHRIQFEVPYAPQVGRTLFVEALSNTRVGYAISGTNLFILDTALGEVVSVFDLVPYADPHDYSNEFGFALAEGATRTRLILWRFRSPSLWAFDLADPVHPAYIGTRDLAHRVSQVSVLPDGHRLLIRQDYRLSLFDLDLGYETFVFPTQSSPYGSWGGPPAVAGTPDRGLVATFDYQILTGNVYRYAVTVYDVTDDRGVRELVSFDPGRDVNGLLVDREGTIVVLTEITSYGYPDSQARYEVRRIGDGSVAAIVEPAGHGTVSTLTEGGGARALVVEDGTGLDVIDLADPGAPRAVGRVEAAFSTDDISYRYGGGITTSRSEPLVFAGAFGGREVLAVDVRDATIAGRFATGQTPPLAVRLREGGDTRDLVVPAARWFGYGPVYERGGSHEILFADATNPVGMTVSGRVVRNLPREIDGLASVGGSLGVAVDGQQNSIALVRLGDGRVLDVTGFGVPVGQLNTYGARHVVVQGSLVLVWGEAGFAVFRVAGDCLVPVSESYPEFGGFDAATLRPDGTVVTLGYDENDQVLETYLADGRHGRLPMDGYYLSLSLSPTGGAALVGEPSPWSDEGFVRMIDLADPAAPRLAWKGIQGWSAGDFDPNDGTLFGMTNHDWNAFAAAKFDAGTGAEIGGACAAIPKNYYQDLGAMSGHGDRARAVVWKWTWDGWETVLFDVSTPTPKVLKILPEFFGVPDYLAREGEGWYEIQSDFGAADFLIADGDGEQSTALHVDDASHDLPVSVRHGLFATVGNGGLAGRFVSLWRDTALNRPPVARAEGDRAVECAGTAGTRVHLDGTASTDPDSTPGTQDDIASYAWFSDGVPATEGAGADVTLTRGEHDVALTVTDLLGATGGDTATIEVVDTQPPSMTLTLDPVIAGGVWANLFAPHGSANDQCDGPLAAPAERLLLPPGASTAPASWVSGASPTVALRRRPSGDLAVELIGPDPVTLRAAWTAVVASGGFALDDGAPVALVLAAEGRGKDAGLVARYGLDATGRLARATAFGAGDHVVEASAADSSGHSASTSVSLRAALAGFCGQTPESVACAGGVAKRAPSAQMSTRRRPVPAQ